MYKYIPPPIEIGQATDVGRRRHENQDSLGYQQLDKFAYKAAHLLIVADGMGGASGGQLASRTVVEKILEYFRGEHPNPEPDLAMKEAIKSAADAVRKIANSDPQLEGMGTTCVIVIVHNGYLFAGHIGDSRLYLWRHGKLHRLSRDHSRVQFMVEAGIISEEDARKHPQQNFLARVLGSNQKPRIEILAPPRKLELGDRILLCSDGLYNEVPEHQIAEILEVKPPQEATNTLVDMANTAGGNDNISVQILAYGPIPPPQQSETWFPFSNAITMALCLFIALGLFFVAGYVVGKYNQSLPTERTQLETNRESSQSHTDQSSVPTRDTELAPIDERLPDILENSELSLGEITTIPPIDSKAAPKQPASDLKLPKTVQPLTKPALIKTTPDQVAPKQPASDITAPASARELPKTIHTSTKPALIKTTPATRPAAMPSEHLPSTLPTHIEDSK